MQGDVSVESVRAVLKLGYVHGGVMHSGGLHWTMISMAIKSLLSGEAWH